MTEIPLLDSVSTSDIKITQLYEHVELYSQGDPPRHTLFVMGQEASLAQIENVAQLERLGQPSNQLLLIDPPGDTRERFKLEGDVAALFTGAPLEVSLPRLQTQPGGTAHVRMGNHFLDIYTQPVGNVVHLPALGILLGGGYGSDAALPAIAENSDGTAELDTLRLLARLVKERRLQLYIPRVGEPVSEPVEAMRRLAADVAYLHGLMRVIPAMAQRGDANEDETLQTTAESLLPQERQSDGCRETHAANVRHLYEQSRAAR